MVPAAPARERVRDKVKMVRREVVRLDICGSRSAIAESRGEAGAGCRLVRVGTSDQFGPADAPLSSLWMAKVWPSAAARC